MQKTKPTGSENLRLSTYQKNFSAVTVTATKHFKLSEGIRSRMLKCIFMWYDFLISLSISSFKKIPACYVLHIILHFTFHFCFASHLYYLMISILLFHIFSIFNLFSLSISSLSKGVVLIFHRIWLKVQFIAKKELPNFWFVECMRFWPIGSKWLEFVIVLGRAVEFCIFVQFYVLIKTAFTDNLKHFHPCLQTQRLLSSVWCARIQRCRIPSNPSPSRQINSNQIH